MPGHPSAALAGSPFACALALVAPHCPAAPPPITFNSLITELTDPDSLARFPDPAYRPLLASSYNRESTRRDLPGWFADSDGTGFIREEKTAAGSEWVIMEHTGPGSITRIWTPYFYYDLNNHTGPNIRIYLDGSQTPVIDESLIKLVRGEGSFADDGTLASPTARAGDCYVPIPFATSCRITMNGKPFYYLIDYRAYAEGVGVKPFTMDAYRSLGTETKALLKSGPGAVSRPGIEEPGAQGETFGTFTLQPGTMMSQGTTGPSAIRRLTVRLPEAVTTPAILRSIVLVASFDDEECIWCPIGDFFSCPDSIHPFNTGDRSVSADGTMSSTWVMPFRRSASIQLINTGSIPVKARLSVGENNRIHPESRVWTWDDRSMHFHANWRPDDVVPGTPFCDWNFIDIAGKGVYVGDSWAILNPQKGTWWGEGDHKVYIDGDWDRGFPSHFGTGTEDYYGWAGGEIPTRRDEFSRRWLANVRVGGLDGTTLGFNICTRTRGLDAMPFATRLRFDMESSFGTDIRNPWNHLGYSSVVFWYAIPGATHNLPPMPVESARPIMSLVDDPQNGKKVVR